MNTAGNLPIPMAPMMFDTFHVPLINKYYYFIALSFVYLLKEILISFVNKDLLELGKENVSSLDEPVCRVGIKTLLGKS